MRKPCLRALFGVLHAVAELQQRTVVTSWHVRHGARPASPRAVISTVHSGVWSIAIVVSRSTRMPAVLFPLLVWHNRWEGKVGSHAGCKEAQSRRQAGDRPPAEDGHVSAAGI